MSFKGCFDCIYCVNHMCTLTDKHFPVIKWQGCSSMVLRLSDIEQISIFDFLES